MLTDDSEVRCFWIEGLGPQSQASFGDDITQALLPPDAATGVAHFCAGPNYLCTVGLDAQLRCGSTALDAPLPEVGQAGAYPGLYRAHASHFVAGPFLAMPNVSYASCGERQICVVHNPKGGADGADSPSSDVACFSLQFARDWRRAPREQFTLWNLVERVAEHGLGPDLEGLHDVRLVATSEANVCVITSKATLMCASPEGGRLVVPPQLTADVLDVDVDGRHSIVCATTSNRDLNCFRPSTGDMYTLPPAATRDVRGALLTRARMLHA